LPYGLSETLADHGGLQAIHYGVATRLRLFVIAGGAVLAACGSSGPTTPSTRVLDVIVKGTSVLVAGQTTQLTAMTDAGQDVTVGVDWRTSDLNVASISPLGLLTAKRTGTANINATYKGATGTLNVVVNPVLISSPSITSCGNVVASGAYVLANDISESTPFGACLTIQASAVQIDCRNHTVTGMLVSNVTDVTVTNCTFVTELFGTGKSFATVDNSTHVTFEHNTMSEIVLKGGNNNQVLQNTIDGGYDGSGRQVGQDDGILLIDEANDTIQGNTISNVFDAGIEGVDVVMNSVIANNTIVNTGTVGISSYWCTSWTGNTISGNSVSRSPGLFRFEYKVGTSKCLNPSTPGAFANNKMVGNRFSSPIFGADSSMWFNFPTVGGAGVFNNLIQGNDVGSAPGPAVVPASGFINGGGNICPPSTSTFCGGT
jgi:parallel beta-helix repeat protein